MRVEPHLGRGRNQIQVGTAALAGASGTEEIGVFSLSHGANAGTTTLGSLTVAAGLPDDPPVDPPTPTELTTFSTNGRTAVGTADSSTISGRGADTWGGPPQHDDDHTASYLPGGFTSTTTVQVDSQPNTSPYARAGLMVRSHITGAGSSTGYTVLAVTPGIGIALESDRNGDGYVETECGAAITQHLSGAAATGPVRIGRHRVQIYRRRHQLNDGRIGHPVRSRRHPGYRRVRAVPRTNVTCTATFSRFAVSNP